MNTLAKTLLLLTASMLAACNDQRPASKQITPAPGASQSTGTPAENPAGGTTGGAGGKYPAESTQSYPPTNPAK